MTSCTHRPRTAFTLVEVLLVAVIIATLGVIATARVSRAATDRSLSLAATILASDIERAREQARALGMRQTIEFEDQGYRVVLSDATQSTIRTVTLNSADIAGTSFTDAALTFDAFGSPSEAGRILIAIGSDWYIIRVAEGTGEITTRSKSQEGGGAPEPTPTPPADLPPTGALSDTDHTGATDTTSQPNSTSITSTTTSTRKKRGN